MLRVFTLSAVRETFLLQPIYFGTVVHCTGLEDGVYGADSVHMGHR